MRHVSLQTAAALAYFELTRKVPDATSAQWMGHTVLEVAHALSSVVTLYTQEPGAAHPRKIDTSELLSASFERGARALRKANGEELRDLSVRRVDLYASLGILRRAGLVFAAPARTADQTNSVAGAST